MSITRQCELIGLPRSTWYYEPEPETAENLHLMRLLDEQYTHTPFYGSRRMAVWLQRHGCNVNRKRVQRLMRLMGLEAIYPKPRTTVTGRGHQVYPYLLRNLEITRPDQVWSADITYVPMPCGVVYQPEEPGQLPRCSSPCICMTFRGLMDSQQRPGSQTDARICKIPLLSAPLHSPRHDKQHQASAERAGAFSYLPARHLRPAILPRWVLNRSGTQKEIRAVKKSFCEDRAGGRRRAS